jgi:aminopeptidase-like protein
MDTKAPDTPLDGTGVGEEIFRLIGELFPICRSISGDGFRETLEILQHHIPLETHEVPSGTRVFDWSVPNEWNIRDAYVRGPKGEKIIDFRRSNLHVVSYSVPVNRTVSLDELKKHLHTLPDYPDRIPYKTSYYREDWGFCLSYNDFLRLKEGNYKVVIDSTLGKGSLTYGECYLEGDIGDEILISAHACHPSLANDNLSGVGLATLLARNLAISPHKFSYRFLFIPGTIGAITWLCLNEQTARCRIKNGLVLSGVGDPGNLTYKKSRSGTAEIDRAAGHILRHAVSPGRILNFSPYGYDERQFCSPGFNLPVGRLSRTPFGEYPEYHTSADNLEFIRASALSGSFETIRSILGVLENNRVFINLNPNCEPQLGKYGLFESPGTKEIALLWVLNLSDSYHSLLDIAEASGLEFSAINAAADLLVKAGLLAEIAANDSIR